MNVFCSTVFNIHSFPPQYYYENQCVETVFLSGTMKILKRKDVKTPLSIMAHD